jgi:hypothetical protein
MTTDIEDDWYVDWYQDNEKDLMEAFVDDNPDEWIEFLDMKRATLEQDDLDYWKVLFCKEEMEQDFLDYCQDEYSNYRDLLETEARLE